MVISGLMRPVSAHPQGIWVGHRHASWSRNEHERVDRNLSASAGAR